MISSLGLFHFLYSEKLFHFVKVLRDGSSHFHIPCVLLNLLFPSVFIF
jgi:hypothetical protein